MKLGFEILSIVWMGLGIVWFAVGSTDKAIYSLIFCLIMTLMVVNISIKELKDD